MENKLDVNSTTSSSSHSISHSSHTSHSSSTHSSHTSSHTSSQTMNNLEYTDETDDFLSADSEILLPQNDEPRQNGRRLRRRQSEGDDDEADNHAAVAADTEFLSELNCGPTRCSFLACTVGPLAKRQFTLFKVRSRLWVRTLDRLERNDIEISSKLTGRVTRLPYGVNPAYLGHRSHLVTTQVSSLAQSLRFSIPILTNCKKILILPNFENFEAKRA
jgi:hypothetical protein